MTRWRRSTRLCPSKPAASRLPPGAIAEPIEIAHVAVGDGPMSIYSGRDLLRPGRARNVRRDRSLAPARTPAARRDVARVAKGAELKHVAAVGDEPELHVETQVVELEADAELNAFGFVSGGDLTRRQIFATMAGRTPSRARRADADRGTRRADTTSRSFTPRRAGTAGNSTGRSSTTRRSGCFRAR